MKFRHKLTEISNNSQTRRFGPCSSWPINRGSSDAARTTQQEQASRRAATLSRRTTPCTLVGQREAVYKINNFVRTNSEFRGSVVPSDGGRESGNARFSRSRVPFERADTDERREKESGFR